MGAWSSLSQDCGRLHLNVFGITLCGRGLALRVGVVGRVCLELDVGRVWVGIFRVRANTAQSWGAPIPPLAGKAWTRRLLLAAWAEGQECGELLRILQVQ